MLYEPEQGQKAV